jgi:hypothetical protein
MNGNQIFSRANCLLYPTDRNGMRTLSTAFGANNLENWNNFDKMCDYFNCGFPHYGINSALILKSVTGKPNIESTKYSLNRVSRSAIEPTKYEIEFSLELKTLAHITFAPQYGMDFVNSTLKTQRVSNRNHIAQVTKGLKENQIITIKAFFEVNCYYLFIKIF